MFVKRLHEEGDESEWCCVGGSSGSTSSLFQEYLGPDSLWMRLSLRKAWPGEHRITLLFLDAPK